MRNLFRRASFLFWQYPILWLPIVIVDPIVFCLNILCDKLTHAIILSLASSHSVLGNTPEPIVPSSPQILKMVLLTKPIDWGTHLIALCLYVSAMIVTFTLITKLRSRQELSFSSILYPLQQAFTSLVLFSLKLLIAIGIAAIPLILLSTFFVQRNGARFISTEIFGYISATILFCAIACLMAPAALTLLRPRELKAIPQETARQARISAVLTIIASSALYFFAVRIKPSFLSRSTPWSVAFLYEIVASLVSAAPYIVLFIALSLLARGNESGVELFAGEPELT